MEEKILKSTIFTEETVFSDKAEQPIDVDFTLPDFCPDISRIFKCRAVPRISSKGISGKNITVDGSVCLTLLYCDMDGMLCSYEYLYPFSKSLQMSGECNEAVLNIKAKCEYINCRAVTGRKIDIHGAVGLDIKVIRRKETEIISDVDDALIEQKRQTTAATVPMGYAEKYLLIEEDIQIGQGQEPVGKILRYDAKPCIKESKLINDKIVVKGDMSVWILYCAADGCTTRSVKTVIPFSQLIDMAGVTEECECDTKSEVCFLEIKPRANDGEVRSLSLNSKLLISAKAYCGNDIVLLSDAFSRKYNADMKSDKIPIESICDSIGENFHCKKNIELDAPITSVSDLWCDIQSVNTKFENTNMIINGTLAAFLITEGSDKKSYFFEKSIDFSYKYDLKRNTDLMHCSPEIDVASLGYTITAANTIELKIDLNLNAAVYECKIIPLVTDISVDKSSPKAKDTKRAMTIYFCSGGECVWDIAKKYNSSVEEIMNINELKEECLEDNKMLLIPAM